MSLEREKICKLIQPASLFKKLVGDENGCVPHQTMLQKATPHLHIKNKCIDICNEILDQYRRKILDNICIPGNDCQYDAALAYDTYLLQNVSARVHTGMLVAEAKFLQNPEVYTRLVKCYNTAGLVSMLTNLAVENEVLSRVFEKSKASHSERARNNTQYGHLLEPNVVVKIYRDFIIPLTKVVEIKYLYQRCGIEPPQQTSFSYLLRPGDAIAEIVLD